MALAPVDEAQQRDDATVGQTELGAGLLRAQRQLAVLDEVGDDPQAIRRDDAAETLDLDLRVDHDAVGRAAQPAQAPGVRGQVALAHAVAVEDVVQRDDERSAVGAPEAHQPQQRAAVLAPAASVPLHEQDLGICELSRHVAQPADALIHAARLGLVDDQARRRRGRCRR